MIDLTNAFDVHAAELAVIAALRTLAGMGVGFSVIVRYPTGFGCPHSDLRFSSVNKRDGEAS